MKSLHSPKLMLTGDSIAEVTADSIITSNGSRHITDFIVSVTKVLRVFLSNQTSRFWPLVSNLPNGNPRMSLAATEFL